MWERGCSCFGDDKTEKKQIKEGNLKSGFSLGALALDGMGTNLTRKIHKFPEVP
jgi:hypothetical protein